MKPIKFIGNLTYNVVVASAIGLAIGGPAGMMIAGALLALSAIPRKQEIGVLNDEVLKILFSSEIQSNIFPNNAFYKQSRLDGGVQPDVTSIEIPQAGSSQTVIKNPAVFPLTISERTDDKRTYTIDLYATEPTHIRDENELVLSYSKRQDVMADDVFNLNTTIAENIAFGWASNTNSVILRTTGADKTSEAPSGTGTRKKITYEDIVFASKELNIQDIAQEGRVMLVPASMFGDLLNIDEFIRQDHIGSGQAIVTGAIGRVLGFDVFVRSSTPLYDNAGTPVVKAPLTAGAITDNESALFWHPNFVRRAEGSVVIYTDDDKPEFLGSIMNASVRAAGTTGRNDGKGLVMVVEAAGA